VCDRAVAPNLPQDFVFLELCQGGPQRPFHLSQSILEQSALREEAGMKLWTQRSHTVHERVVPERSACLDFKSVVVHRGFLRIPEAFARAPAQGIEHVGRDVGTTELLYSNSTPEQPQRNTAEHTRGETSPPKKASVALSRTRQTDGGE
jgi:hypothetical protein